jgi:hypothetical protein
VSPTARKIAAQKLYSETSGIPKQYIIRYLCAIENSDSLHPVHTKKYLQQNKPIIENATPKSKAVAIEVPTNLFAPSLSLAPLHFATNTFVAIDKPIKNTTNRFTITVVEPTAPTAESLANCESTNTSAELNNICNKLTPINGRAKIISFLSIGPVVASISFERIVLAAII